MRKELSVSIIIPVWNGRKLLEKNLPSIIKASNNPKNKISEIILVDDASPDDSIQFVNENYKKQVRIVRLKRNRGFAGAVNMGVYASSSPLICLLNMDVIPEKNFLESVFKLFDDKDVFAVGLHEKGYGPAVAQFQNGYIGYKPGNESNSIQESMWASGGSSILKRSLWIKLKGLDEELYSPFYSEDVDLGYRAWKRGYKILWDPNARVEHKHESVINPEMFAKRYLIFIKERNILLLTQKNLTSQRLWKKHKREIFKRVIRHPGYLRVLYAAWQNREVVRRRREKELKQTKVSDEAIFERFEK